MIALTQPRRRWRLSLTPMIDVVFLLLVFFMLAARFGGEDAVQLTPPISGGTYEGAPRLVSVGPDSLRLNGNPASMDELVQKLSGLVTTPADVIVVRPEDGVALQGLVDALTALGRAGFTNLVVIE